MHGPVNVKHIAKLPSCM